MPEEIILRENEDTCWSLRIAALRMILEHCRALVTTAGTANEAHRILALLRPHALASGLHCGSGSSAPRPSTRCPGLRGLRRFWSSRSTRSSSVTWYGDS